MRKTTSLFSHRVGALALAFFASSVGCVRDIAVGTRPDDTVLTDAGTRDDAGTLICTQADCEVSVLSTPVCEEYEELSCVTENDACEWKCLVRPLVAGETACGSAICGPNQFCDAPLGTCGQSADARCLERPALCTRELAPVCGCNGLSYSNACEAQRAGVPVALSVACPAPAIVPCTSECEAPPPVEISMPKCPDGDLQASVCAELGDGTCSWLKRKCQADPICQQPSPVDAPGACWTAADCKAGQTCEGASVCPCDAECVEPDKPGACV